MLAGINAARIARGQRDDCAPRASATGSLAFYLANADAKRFQPANTTFALIPARDGDERKQVRRKAERRRMQVERGLAAFRDWLKESGESGNPQPLAVARAISRE
jgi:methylenetetrahydrofolate--tRNA-(uracil-5-)-methyltransferase